MTVERGASASLESRAAAALVRAGAVGVVVGVSVAGARETAAAGVADARTGLAATADMTIPVASVGKPVVAAAMVRLWQQQGIALDAPILDIVPALAPDWRAAPMLALTHLLSHTSGLRPDVPPAEAESYGDEEDALDRAVRATVHRGQTYRLGAAWQYCNAGFGVAGYCLGALQGRPFEPALATVLLGPAGMPKSGFGPAEAVGHAGGVPKRLTYARSRRPGGGLVSTVDDLLSFSEFAMADEAVFAATGRPVTPSLIGSSYGLGWNLSLGGRVRWHFGDWGGCHSALLLAPAERVAVVVVVNSDEGMRLRRDLGWAELSRYTGRRRPRITPALRIGQAATRSALAAVARPR